MSRTRGSSARFLVVVLFLIGGLPSSGCALLVGGANGLETTACHFQGESTSCGRCVTAECQADVNACCADSTCDTNLGYLDGCASTGDLESCTLLESGSFLSGSAAFQALSSCISGKCTACRASSYNSSGTDSGTGDSGGKSPWISCDVLTQNDCFCVLETGTPRTTPACSTSTVPNAVCCADVGWPNQAVGAIQPQCSCETLGCTDQGSTDCFCQGNIMATADGDAVTCGAGWGPCCVSPGSYCSCSSSPCTSGYEVQVSACTPAAIGCPKGQFAVTSCSK